jgi:hypothetical protein
MTLADPYVSIIWGAVVFGEVFRGGVWIVLAILSGALMTASAVLLAGASALHGEQAAEEEQCSPQSDEPDGHRSAARPG